MAGSVPGDHGQHVAQCHLWQLLFTLRKTSFPFCGHLLIFLQNKHCIHYLKQSQGLVRPGRMQHARMIHSVCSLAPLVPLLTTGECENNPSCGGQRGQQKNSLWLSQRSNSVWPIEGFDSYMWEEGAQLCPVNQLKPAQQKGGKMFC